MDSQLEIINKLIEEGETYTFENTSSRIINPSDPRTSYQSGNDTPEWSAFKVRVRNIISELASENSPAIKLAKDGLRIRTIGNGSSKFNAAKQHFMKALKIAKATLEDDVFGELKKTQSEAKSPVLSNKVFVVHGHDQGLKTDVERFIHEIGLVPVVLHREADQGATIIEKLEENSDVGYAFILLTPDEVSFAVDQIGVKDAQRKKEYRARPNVIFEFGYFVGKLGRSRVCCLHKGDVVIPSDLDGLVYKKVDVSIDAEAYSIIKELKAVGYKINM